MALPHCPDCGSTDLDLVERLPDGRRHLICCACDHDWVYGEATAPTGPASSYDAARSRFPTAGDVSATHYERAERLKEQFLRQRPELDPRVPPYWERYQRAFSIEHMDETPDQEFKDFANSPVGAYAGQMTVFNDAWNEMGPELAARRVRDSLKYLLYGPEQTPIEDRLTHLIRGDNGMGMKGFRESLLTKVLCIVRPEQFLPITMYTGLAGKREIADVLYGLTLPRPEATSATPGRLVFWSNDLLRALVGDGFLSLQHASQFLWWAKDEVVTA
jgi:hypothetical protein